MYTETANSSPKFIIKFNAFVVKSKKTRKKNEKWKSKINNSKISKEFFLSCLLKYSL